jgi:hypothetical protein
MLEIFPLNPNPQKIRGHAEEAEGARVVPFLCVLCFLCVRISFAGG